MAPHRRALDAGDDGGLQDMRFTAQAEKMLARLGDRGRLVHRLAVDLKHLVGAQHHAAMVGRDLHRLGFGQKISLFAVGRRRLEAITDRLLVDIGDDLLEGEPAPFRTAARPALFEARISLCSGGTAALTADVPG